VYEDFWEKLPLFLLNLVFQKSQLVFKKEKLTKFSKTFLKKLSLLKIEILKIMMKAQNVWSKNWGLVKRR